MRDWQPTTKIKAVISEENRIIIIRLACWNTQRRGTFFDSNPG